MTVDRTNAEAVARKLSARAESWMKGDIGAALDREASATIVDLLAESAPPEPEDPVRILIGDWLTVCGVSIPNRQWDDLHARITALLAKTDEARLQAARVEGAKAMRDRAAIYVHNRGFSEIGDGIAAMSPEVSADVVKPIPDVRKAT